MSSSGDTEAQLSTLSEREQQVSQLLLEKDEEIQRLQMELRLGTMIQNDSNKFFFALMFFVYYFFHDSKISFLFLFDRFCFSKCLFEGVLWTPKNIPFFCCFCLRWGTVFPAGFGMSMVGESCLKGLQPVSEGVRRLFFYGHFRQLR